MRQAAGRRPAGEAQRVTDAGTEVILIHPTVPDLDVMVTNLMSRARRHEVIETATRTVTDHLAASPIGERLARLSAGHPELVRRPAGPPADWPDLPAAARARWDRAPRRRAA